MPLEMLLESGRRQQDVAGCDDQPAAVEQRAPDLERRRVERRVRCLDHDIVRPECHVVIVYDEPDDRSVLDHHSLWLTGRARCVHDVGEVVGAHGRSLDVGGSESSSCGSSRSDDGCLTELDTVGEPLFGEDDSDTGVPGHGRQPLVRVVGIERDVRAARLQDGEEAGDEFG